jgi:hypothetical protein
VAVSRTDFEVGEIPPPPIVLAGLSMEGVGGGGSDEVSVKEVFAEVFVL